MKNFSRLHIKFQPSKHRVDREKMREELIAEWKLIEQEIWVLLRL